MCRLAKWWVDNPNSRDNEVESILKQLARELMLLSASDWQFLISTFAARDYAELRLAEHYGDFKRLATMAEKKIDGGTIEPGEWKFFEDCRLRDSLFEDIEIEWFSGVEYPADKS